MSRSHVIEHPLIAHNMSVLRNKETKTPLFRQTLREVAYLMTFAVTQHLDMVAVRIETPLGAADCYQLKAPNPSLVSISRAGNGLTETLQPENIIPSCQAIFLRVRSFLLIQYWQQREARSWQSIFCVTMGSKILSLCFFWRHRKGSNDCAKHTLMCQSLA